MTTDLTRLIMNSNYGSFKNNNIYTGSFTISGTVTAGTTIKTFNVSLGTTPDLADISFNGPSDTHWEGTFGEVDPRPDSGWFKQGAIWVRGDDSPSGYDDYTTNWRIYSSISGTTLTISAVWVQQFVASLALTSTTGYYRLVDYSVF